MIPAHPFLWSEGSRGRRVTHGIAVLWILSLADLFFTLWAHSFTPFDELNPLAAVMLDHGLITVLVLTKLALTTVGVTIFWRLRVYRRVELAMWFVVVVYLLLALRWSSYTSGVIALATSAA